LPASLVSAPPAEPSASLVSAPPPTQPDPADLAARALELYKLGNPPSLIRATLERTGASPALVTRALEGVQAQEDQRRSRHRRTFVLVGGGSLVVLVLLILGAVIRSVSGTAAAGRAAQTAAASAGPTLTPGGPTLTPGGPTPPPTVAFNPIVDLINSFLPGDVKIVNGESPTPGPTSEFFAALFPPTATLEPATATAAFEATRSARATQGLSAEDDDLPAWVRDLVPDGISIINVPTPSVSAEGPASADCPRTTGEAVALFGGELEHWQFDRDNAGWILIVVGSPITIRIPANMSAGYLVAGDTFEMRSLLGPATLTNVNFAAVACGL
jgi:hypothetical protein